MHKVDRIAEGEMTEAEARAALGGLSPAAWRRLIRARTAGAQVRDPAKPTGRPPLHDWPEADVQAIREVYLRTNRGRDAGSMSHAVRRVVWEAKRAPEGLAPIGPETRRVLENLHARSSTKHYIPRSLRRKLAIAPQIVRHHRSPRVAALDGPYVPGMLRLSLDGTRRLVAGERFVGDDGSQNQIVCVPWPWGGSKEADKYGIRTARGQWLVLTDCATDKIVAWSFTMRPRDSYREADTLGLVYRSCRDVCAPAEIVMEGGSWQTRRIGTFLGAAGIRLIDARGRPNLKLVEGVFNRAWTFLSVDPRGQIGRFRGEYQRENDLLMRCRSGSEDGRKHFPLLPDLLRNINDCVDYHNQDPIESKEYGRWVPNERWAADLAEHPRAGLSSGLAPIAAPECRLLTVRRGGMIEARVQSPLGVSSLYVFADECLAPYEKAKVRVAFDPFEPEPVAAVMLAGGSNLGRPGDLIGTARCWNPPPLPVARFDWQMARDTGAAAAAMKKAMSKAVRTEYQALGSGGRRGARLTETRGPDGVERIEINGGRADADSGDSRRSGISVNPRESVSSGRDLAAVTGRGSTLSSPDPVRPRRAIKSRMELLGV